MPIDQFGREIPAVGGGGAANGHLVSPPFGNPLLLGGELSARRDHHDHEGGDGIGGGGDIRVVVGELQRSSSPAGGGGASTSWSHDHHNDERRGGGGGGDGHGSRGGRPRGRSRADSSSSSYYDDRSRRSGGGGGGRHRGRSHGEGDREEYRYGGRQSNNGRSSHRGSLASSSLHTRVKAHASERYAEQPMLCRFLWKKELEEEQHAMNSTAKMQKFGDVGGNSSSDSANNNGGDRMSKDEVMGGMEYQPSNEANPQEEEVETKPLPPPLFDTIDAEMEAYSEYNTKYCLNYVRTFFNHHLDDPWFRNRLSPLEKYRQASKERARANYEANEMKKEMIHSLEDMNSGVIPKKDPDCPEYLGPPKCNFVASCRLGVGTKPSSTSLHQRDYYYEMQTSENDIQHNILQGEDRNKIERHAKSHLHSFIKSESCVKIMDVPPNLSDDQLFAALVDHCGNNSKPIAVWSDSVCIPMHDNETMDPYHRTAYAVFPASSAKDAMLENLHKANEDVSRHHRDHDRRHRSKGDALPRTLELEVDCTDVYGRREIDADGKGSAPPSSGKKKGVYTKLPTKRCSVFVSTSLLASSQPVSVLSAALSSRDRISQDKLDAGTIAGLLDEARGIEAGNRLCDLLRLLYPGNEEQTVDDEDVLDVSIAYLRRVHLFSFYNGCTAATDIGNVLSFSHPAGMIHLRLKGANEILAKAAEEKSVGETTGNETEENSGKDMLVQRLDESIIKAIKQCKAFVKLGPSCLIDAITDAEARTIQSTERNASEEWIENHSLIDEDGRARCSFHFCRKLFKDKAFLQKHLLKKHSDQLRSECAKCHDGPMMSAWDSDDTRPVPPVLIDCGSRFGLIPSRVIGSDRPFANDPEPELWQEEQDRIAEEERIRRQREAAEREVEEEMQRRRDMANAREKRKSNFVDPDDMVEEKVELSFENMLVAPPPKKKKKKKSLL
ncbi:hypothetical protein ACHAXH_008725 [Discostella pseudostelligera]